jgi:hypothetical protein
MMAEEEKLEQPAEQTEPQAQPERTLQVVYSARLLRV